MDESWTAWFQWIVDAAAAVGTIVAAWSGAVLSFLDRHGGGLIAVFTVVLAFSLLGLRKATLRLARGGEQQMAAAREAATSAGASAAAAAQALDHARQASERELRAYVNVDVCEVVGFRMEPGQRPTVRVLVKNSGKTPALEVVMHFDIAAAAPQPPTWPQPRAGGESKRLPMAPGAIIPWQASIGPLTQQLIDELKTDKLRLHVFGTVTYRDAFGHDRETTFRATTRGTETDANGRQSLQATDGNTCN